MNFEIHDWIFSNRKFLEQYEKILLDSVSAQFSTIKKDELNQTNINIEYLLNCASILSTSRELHHTEVALRITQFVLVSSQFSELEKLAAVSILNSMANSPSIELAIKNKLLNENYYENLGPSQLLHFKRSNITHKIYLNSGIDIVANNFQQAAWQSLNNRNCIVLSAPTSVGKSYLLLQWILEEVRKEKANIIYLVPTRALVYQVENDLRDMSRETQIDLNLISIPSKFALSRTKSNICIFTQERLHYFLGDTPNFNIAVLVIDEAHKVGDGYRGILLQQAIERIVYLGETGKIIFAVPNSLNPEALIEDLPKKLLKESISNSSVTVNQNLFWVYEDSNNAKSWAVDHIGHIKTVRIGNFILDHEPNTLLKRLVFISYHIGKETNGNIIYADGAADAEKIALLLAEMVSNDIEDDELIELSKLTHKAVHQQYRLSVVIKRGIAFHYGNMPLILRLEIERLFKIGKVKFLICTSTLIEGVNLPCKNIFLRCPQKGRNIPMTPEDFWNLAGRAGRWGKEFQGNIFCIDPYDSKWSGGIAPSQRKKIPIQRTVDSVLKISSDFISYLSGSSSTSPQNISKFEYMESYLASLLVSGNSLIDSPWAKRFDSQLIENIQEIIEKILEEIKFSPSVLIKNPGISVIGMNKLFTYFDARLGDKKKAIEDLLPPAPTSSSAVDAMTAIFSRINKCFGNKFGYGKSGAVFYNALLTIQWMQGHSLPRIIDGRIRAKQNKNPKISLSAEIRDTMSEVENIARFTAPKYLSCYSDLLQEFYIKNNREDLAQNIKDLNLLLEFGVPLKTQISLMSLGLSRTTAIELSNNIPNDSLSRLEVYEYLVSKKWEIHELPIAMQNEIAYAISNHLPSELREINDVVWDS